MKISVVIPAYNAAAFLPRSIASVRAQTLQPVEVIVVDDGSTDDTKAVAAGLGVRVITRTNSGPSAAKNTGIRMASGDWIALLDADDRWSPEKLERQAQRASRETILIYTGIRVFDDHRIQGLRPAVDAASAVKMLRYTNPIPNSGVLVRREAVLSQAFREEVRHGEDWELWFRLSRLGQWEAVTEPLTDYYVHGNSLSANPERMMEGLDQFIDTTLLADLHGLNRWAWRQRVRASQLCAAGLIARNNHLESEFRYMVRSMCAWPLPGWEPRRLAMLAVSAKNRWRKPA
jgi:glycosyltransferase involved in cell wall biosynthesis